MRLEMLIVLLLLYSSCENVKDSEYEVKIKLYSDRIDYFLFQDQLLIDSTKYQVSHQIIDGRTPYQELGIDISEDGWSCTHLDTIVLYNRRYLNGRFNFENKFLNTIIEIENLELRDSIEILAYWKEIFPTHLKTSADQDWVKVIDIFYNEFVFKESDSVNSKYHLDKCEIEMYKAVYEELISKQSGVYYATTWAPGFLEEKSLRKYNFHNKRLELIGNQGIVVANVNGGNYIKFR